MFKQFLRQDYPSSGETIGEIKVEQKLIFLLIVIIGETATFGETVSKTITKICIRD